MKHRCSALAAALTFAGLAAPAPAQEPDQDLARLPADATTVLVLRDVLPPLEKLLASPAVSELLKATGDLQQQAFGLRLDAAGLMRQIGLFRNYVPVSAGFGMSDSGRDALTAIVRAGLQTMLLLQSKQVEGVPPEWTDQLDDELADALAAVREPSLAAWLVLRDERTAEQWFEAVAEAVQPLDQDEAIEVVVADGSLTMKLDVLRMRDQRLGKMLAASGASVPKDFGLQLSLQLVQEGPELRLRVGTPAAGPLPKQRMGPLWSVDPAQVLTMRMNLAPMADVLAEESMRVAELAEVDAGASWALSMLTAQLQAAALQMQQLVLPIEGSVRVDDGIRFVSEVELGELADETSVPERLLRCLRPDEGPFQVNGATLDFALLGTLEEGLARAGRRGPLPFDIEGLHQFLLGEESAVFAPGTAFVSRAASFRGGPGWTGGPMPFGAFALLAALGDGEDGQAFVQELGLQIGEAAELDGVLWEPKDLGLGVPTQAMRLVHLPGPFGEGVDADFAPHWLVSDGLLIFSTDVALSRDLIRRLRGEDPAVALPGSAVVDWTVWRSDHLAAVLDGGSRWLEALGELPDVDVVRQWMPLVTAVVRSFDSFEWITELDGSRARTRLDLRLSRRVTTGAR